MTDRICALRYADGPVTIKIKILILLRKSNYLFIECIFESCGKLGIPCRIPMSKTNHTHNQSVGTRKNANIQINIL